MNRGRAILSTLAAILLVGCTIPRWPVAGPMTSAFGMRWSGLLPGLHRGVDIAVPEGTEVRAMAPGLVIFSGTMDGYGNVVWIDHGGEVVTVYAHLSESRVRIGDAVRGHAVIALSGKTGDASGPHLHFEIWRWGGERDPVQLLGGPPPRRR